MGIAGYEHLRYLWGPCLAQTADIEILTALSPDSARARDWKRELKCRSFCTSFDLLLTNPDLDALLISDCEDMPSDWVKLAISAGKNILATGPIALSLQEFDRLVAKAHSSDAVFMIASPWMFDPILESVKQRLAIVAIGSLLQATFRSGFDPKIKGGDTSNFVRAITPSLDLAHSFFGCPDTVSADLDFSAGGTGTLIVAHQGVKVVHCINRGSLEVSCRIEGAEGSLTFQVPDCFRNKTHEQSITIKQNGKPARPLTSGLNRSSCESISRMITHFAERCLSVKSEKDKLDHNRSVLETAIAAVLASRDGVRMTLPLTHSHDLYTDRNSQLISIRPAIIPR